MHQQKIWQPYMVCTTQLNVSCGLHGQVVTSFSGVHMAQQCCNLLVSTKYSDICVVWYVLLAITEIRTISLHPKHGRPAYTTPSYSAFRLRSFLHHLRWHVICVRVACGPNITYVPGCYGGATALLAGCRLAFQGWLSTIHSAG